MVGSPVNGEALDDDDLVRAYTAGASIRELARRSRRSRAAVRAVIVAAGYSPAARGAGRPRPHLRLPVDDQLTKKIHSLYVDLRQTRRQISEQLDIPEHTVRSVLDRLGVRTRTRGRLNREDRTRIPAGELERLYVDQELTIAQVAVKLGTSPAIVAASLHDNGIAVRHPTRRAHREEVRVLAALYQDPEVLAMLDRHNVPHFATPGQLADRVPEPVPLTEVLIRDLYQECGLSTVHIEMLTGQPSIEIYRQMTRFGIPRRSAGGLSPWRRRLSAVQSDAYRSR